MNERIWTLEGVRNFRDFGGYQTKGGGRVVAGQLFRSASFAEASAADIAKLNALGVKFIIDLRRSHERAASPNVWPGEGTRTIVYDGAAARAAVGDTESAPHIDVARVRRSQEEQREFMRSYYGRAAFSDRFVDQFAAMFRAMHEEGGPFVVHCAVGKDRTGIACALIHEALGVSREDVFADYILTNAAAAARAARVGAENGPDDAPLPTVGVHEDYLHAAYEAIEKQAGSVETYLTDVLGITPAMRARLTSRFVV